MPTDIWERIFVFALSSPDESEKLDDVRIGCIPNVMLDERNLVTDDNEQFRISANLRHQRSLLVNISHVSQSWRDILLNHPILWSNILITTSTLCACARLDAWLRRSRQVSINVVFDIRRYVLSSLLVAAGVDYTDPFHNALTIIANILYPHLHRCKSISIATSIDVDMRLILSVLNMSPSAANLIQLRLCQHEDDPELDSIIEDARGIRLFNEHTPELTHVRICGIPLLPTILALACNLTTLSLRCIAGNPSRWTDITSLLAQSKSLHNLSIWGFICDDVPPSIDIDNGSQLTLPHLDYLSIGRVETSFAVAMFGLLHTPAVRSLSLSFEGVDCDQLGHQLANTQRNDQSTLSSVRDLDIAGFSVSIETGALMWSELDQLENLIMFNSTKFFYGLLSLTTICFMEQRNNHGLSNVNAAIDPIIAPRLKSADTSGVDVLALSTFIILRRQLNLPLHFLRMPRHDFRVSGNIPYIDRFIDNLDIAEPDTVLD